MAAVQAAISPRKYFTSPTPAVGIVALEGPRPRLVWSQSLCQPRQREDRLLKRGVEQGVADELRGRFTLAHMFAVLLVQAVRQCEQPSDLSDGFLHKRLLVLSELTEENSEEGNGFEGMPANDSLRPVHSPVVLHCAEGRENGAHALIEQCQGPLRSSARASGESAMKTS